MKTPERTSAIEPDEARGGFPVSKCIKDAKEEPVKAEAEEEVKDAE